jgi:hypothetical protein
MLSQRLRSSERYWMASETWWERRGESRSRRYIAELNQDNWMHTLAVCFLLPVDLKNVHHLPSEKRSTDHTLARRLVLSKEPCWRSEAGASVSTEAHIPRKTARDSLAVLPSG